MPVRDHRASEVPTCGQPCACDSVIARVALSGSRLVVYWVYLDEDRLIPDEAPNVVQGPGPNVSAKCPHCGSYGSFASLTWMVVYNKQIQDLETGTHFKGPVIATIRSCPNERCRGIVFFVRGEHITEVVTYPRAQLDFDPTRLPEQLAATLREAVICHSVGAYRAAAIMVRRLLEQICDHNGAKGRDLHSRLLELRAKVTLPVELFEAMMELKILGNDAAHVTAKEYLEVGQDEVADSIELAKEILKSLYQLQALVDRLKARKVSGLPTP